MNAASALPFFHIAGFTGHRQLADPAGVARVITSVLEELRRETPGEWIALSSLAIGSDLIFARAALAAGLGWETVLPLPPAEFRRDFSDREWREVEALLAEAEHVGVIGERSQRDDSYLDCGMETVNHCDLLLAVWDGEPARGRGGTAEIVEYARALNRPIIIIDAKTHRVRRENIARLAIGNLHMSELNALAPAALSPHAAAEDDPGRRTVLEFHHKVDAAATAGAPHLPRLITLTIALHIIAATLAAATLVFDLRGAALPWGKLLCLLAALAATFLLLHYRLRQDWVRYRLAAEITRSAIATWGLTRSLRLFDDFDWVGLEPMRRALDILGRRSARANPTGFDQFKQRYLHERIDGQLAYFARQEARARPLITRLRFGVFTCSALAAFFAAAYTIHMILPEAIAPRWVPVWVYGFAPIVLPVLAASLLALISVNDLHRRVARCSEMRIRLETARSEVCLVKTWGALERIVARAERALLQEVFEWHSITSFSDSE